MKNVIMFMHCFGKRYRCLSPEFLHRIFRDVLELEDFDTMNNKEKRPLNGQYACDLNPDVIKLIAERKESCMSYSDSNGAI